MIDMSHIGHRRNNIILYHRLFILIDKYQKLFVIFTVKQRLMYFVLMLVTPSLPVSNPPNRNSFEFELFVRKSSDFIFSESFN